MDEETTAVTSDGTALVEECLERFFRLAAQRARSYGRSSEDLWRVLQRASSGGKRFRPRILMLAYTSLGGTDLRAAAHVAAAYELLHTALVVHDDVIDRDWSRRGAPNVAGSFRDDATTGGVPMPTAEHRGMSAAVIAGDLALAGAPRLIESSGVDGERRSRLLEILDEAVFASAAGEMSDVDLALGVMPSVDEIIAMGRAKTAVYSFEAPLQSGAVLAGADDRIVRALGVFGREIGIAYQIVDDVLGVFGDEAMTGKSATGDLREGKRTVLIAHAATTEHWHAIIPFLGRSDLAADEIEHLRTRIRCSGALEMARERIDRHVAAACAALDDVPDGLHDRLDGLVSELVDRVR